MSKHTPGAVCNICKTPFDTGLHADCGGDCLMCMAEAGDTDCALTAVTHLKAQRDALLEANEAFGKRQEWWNERMFALEQQRDALLEALKKAEENGCATVYSNEYDECGAKGCCGVVSYKPHADDCWVTTARAAIKALEEEA
jgi:hypothetical protein